ncbi:MAG: sel1 repeat family protein [Magnetococcales bacterium]|nr:sel1 repeat family protein [Magnetococcales bacterium]
MDREQIEEIVFSANRGDVDAQFVLGAMYAMGQGVPHDYQTAAKWFHKAAEQGDPDAQRKLGMIYYHGQGVSQDYRAAIKWFRLAAEQGHDDAQANLGWLYAKGDCVPRDDIQAYMWCQLSAEQGNQNAIKVRDIICERLSPEQVALAEKLAQNWKPAIRNSA